MLARGQQVFVFKYPFNFDVDHLIGELEKYQFEIFGYMVGFEPGLPRH